MLQAAQFPEMAALVRQIALVEVVLLMLVAVAVVVMAVELLVLAALVEAAQAAALVMAQAEQPTEGVAVAALT
jgi:hypothetical protein